MTKSARELSTFQNSMVGAFLGLVEVALTNPLSIIKINLQQQTPIPWSVRGLYRGFKPNAIGFVPLTMAQVGLTPWMQKSFFGEKITYSQEMIAAGTAGAASSIFSCPSERLMALQNNYPKYNLTHIMRKQVHKFGIQSLFVGQVGTLYREAAFTMFWLTYTPWLKNKILPYCNNENQATIGAGFFSGVGTTLVTQPLDTVKTIQQSLPNGISFFKLSRKLTLPDYFKGTVSRSLGVVISIVFMTWFKEKLEELVESKDNSFDLMR